MTIKREYPDQPVVGVAGIVIRHGRVLLVRRGSSRLKGQWSIPGGVLELGETICHAVEREMHEETGLEVRCIALVDAVDVIDREASGKARYHFAILDYLCEWREGEAVSSSDASEHAWVSEGELKAYPLEQVAEAVIQKAFRMQRAMEAGK